MCPIVPQCKGNGGACHGCISFNKLEKVVKQIREDLGPMTLGAIAMKKKPVGGRESERSYSAAVVHKAWRHRCWMLQ